MNQRSTYRARSAIVFSAVVLFLVGCSQAAATMPARQPAAATPTVSALFATPLPATTSPSISTAAAEPTPTLLRPTETFDQQLSRSFTRSTIYSDALDKNWSFNASSLVEVDTKNQAVVDTGKFSLEVTPKVGVTTLLFSIKSSIKEPILRKQVAGIHFRLSGGDNDIPNDSMAVSILGSNKNPFWVEDDKSVTVDREVTLEMPVFSETRLYYLGFDRTIPADEWVDVTNWLKDRQFDPDYTYVTGIAIKVDQKALKRYYLDQVEVLLWPE